MSWRLDPAVEVTLSAAAEFVPDVVRWLGEPQSQRTEGDQAELVYEVTNREGFRSRIYELGPRVQIVGPDEIRAEVIDDLAYLAGE